MVSTKLLPLPTSTIKPKLMRSIPFGSPYAHTIFGYGYEKLRNENESQSLIDSISISSFDSICASSCAVYGVDVDVPAGDDFTAVGSISSVLFSVGVHSMSSDECSYSYSLCSNSSNSGGYSSLTSVNQCGEDGATLDTSDYSNWSFDVSFMSRHAGLDYNGRILPKDKDATSSIKASITSHDDMPHESLQRTDEELLEDVRISKDFCDLKLVTTSCHQQLEKTFDSEADSDGLSSSGIVLLPHKDMSNADEHKEHRMRKWLRKRNPVSALVRSRTSPAA